MKPVLSVIIPVYNAERTLRTAIDSVIMQRCDDVEIVVVDDGSTDGSWEIIESYGDRIVALRQENAGAPTARNYGARVSRGRFLKFVDSDDYILPDTLSKQIAHAVAVPDNHLSFGEEIWLNVNTGSIRFTKHAHYAAVATNSNESMRRFFWHHPFTPSITYSRDAFERIGGFTESLTIRQDYDIFVKAVLQGYILTGSGVYGYVYRQYQEADSISARLGYSDHQSLLSMFSYLERDIKGSTPIYPKEMISYALARHTWAKGRVALQHGHDDIAMQMFRLARKMHSDCSFGRLPYRILLRLIGPIHAEGLSRKISNARQSLKASSQITARVRTHSQNMTTAARAQADRKTFGHLS